MRYIMSKKFNELSMAEINELVTVFTQSLSNIDKDPFERDKNEESQVRKLYKEAKKAGIRNASDIDKEISIVSNEYNQSKNNFFKRLFNPKVNKEIDEFKIRLNKLKAEKKFQTSMIIRSLMINVEKLNLFLKQSLLTTSRI